MTEAQALYHVEPSKQALYDLEHPWVGPRGEPVNNVYNQNEESEDKVTTFYGLQPTKPL